MRERYPILRDISASIRTRRTVEEAELALKLEGEYRADPTLFEDIDFEGLIARIDADARSENVARISTVLTLTLTLPLPLPLTLTLTLTLTCARASTSRRGAGRTGRPSRRARSPARRRAARA